MNQQEPFSLQNMLGFYVNRTAFLMSEGIAQKFASLGYAITAQDFGILSLLWTEDGLKHVDIARHILRDKTTITRRIDSLVKKGILSRKTDAKDRRITRVYLTAQGNEIQAKLIQAIIEFHEDLLQGISKQDLQITIQTLNKIILNRTRT